MKTISPVVPASTQGAARAQLPPEVLRGSLQSDPISLAETLAGRGFNFFRSSLPLALAAALSAGCSSSPAASSSDDAGTGSDPSKGPDAGTVADGSTPGCGAGEVVDGLVISTPLELSSNTVAIGQSISGHATLCNPTSTTIHLDLADIAARPPGGTNAGGPFGLDLSDGTQAISVTPGQSYVLSGGRTFTAADALGSWYAYVTLKDAAGAYDDSTHKVAFTVVAAGATTSSDGGAGSGTGGSDGGPVPPGPTATIVWDDVYQVIDGFGAAGGSSALSAAQADLFFSTGDGGVGLSLLRTGVTDDGSCTSVSTQCAGSLTSTMQMAVARGATVWSTPWSPPASMKTNGTTTNAGYLEAGSYQAYAEYLVNYIKSLAAQGVSLSALSVQNEPNQFATYDSCYWTAQNFHDFILNNLGPTLKANGLSGVQVIMPETGHFSDLNSYAATTLEDPAAAAYVSTVAFHDYDNATATPYPLAQDQGIKFWETEVSDGPGYGPNPPGAGAGQWNPTIDDALFWGQMIHDWLVNANLNAWNWWWLVDVDSSDNQGLVNSDGEVSKRLYMMGNYSKFVRPGWNRIGATSAPVTGVAVSAFKNKTTGAFAIVVLNNNTSAVSQQFSLRGVTAKTLTPWVTSSALDLAQQSAITTAAGDSFTYTLPASSITTLVGASGT